MGILTDTLPGITVFGPAKGLLSDVAVVLSTSGYGTNPYKSECPALFPGSFVLQKLVNPGRLQSDLDPQTTPLPQYTNPREVGQTWHYRHLRRG